MKAPFRWAFPIVAGVATLVALAADTNASVAVPAATVAVAAAALALWDSVRPRAPAVRPAEAPPERLLAGGSEQWFRAGTMGQEAIILLLDRIERALVNPALPNRQGLELAELRGLPREAFLRYLESRLKELEGGL